MRDLEGYEAELLRNPQLVSEIVANPRVFPPATNDPERMIRASSGTLDRAIARGLALAAQGTLTRLELYEG